MALDAQLPQPCLQQILQLLPMLQRFSCTRVCKAWQQAAVAAVTESPLKVTSPEQARKLAAWLKHHNAVAKHVAYEIDYGEFHVTDYPLGLRHLCSFTVGTGNDQQQYLEHKDLKGLPELCQQASQLTSLELHGTTVSDWAAAAPLLTSLQSLKLGAVGAGGTEDHCLPRRHLSHLTAITSLELVNAAPWGAFLFREDPTVACLPALQQLSCLAQLRRLVVGHLGHSDDLHDGKAQQVFKLACKAMTGLQYLTSLTIFECGVKIDDVALAQLTGLQELRLTAGGFGSMWMNSTVLDGMAALRRLEVSLPDGYIGADAELRLLTNIGKMQDLTYLALAYLDSSSQPEVRLKHAVLTAPEFMHTLELTSCHLCPGTWRQLFDPAKPLCHLRRLRLCSVKPSLTAADLKGIAGACLGLQELNLVYSTQPKISLLPLRQLTGLTSLSVSGLYTDSAVHVLAQMTALQQLAVEQCSKVPLISRLQLTTLIHLTRLVVPVVPDGCEDWGPRDVDTFSHKVGVGPGRCCIQSQTTTASRKLRLFVMRTTPLACHVGGKAVATY